MPSGAVAKLIISWKEYSTDIVQPGEWRVPLPGLCMVRVTKAGIRTHSGTKAI